jgi:hypothetical protein
MSDDDPQVHSRSKTAPLPESTDASGATPGASPPSLATACPGAPEAPTSHPGPPLPPGHVWCPGCAGPRLPKIGYGGRISCSVCHKFVPVGDMKVARQGPNMKRREALERDLLTQFPPTNVLERTLVEHVATALERLEASRPGSLDWTRINTVVQALTAQLYERMPPVEAPHGLDAMPLSALQRAHALLTRQASGETLSEFDRGALAILEEAMHGRVRLRPDPEPPVVIHQQYVQPPTPAPAPTPSSESDEVRTQASVLASAKKAARADAQLKIDNYDVWCSIHEDAAEVQELVRQRRHKEMLATLPDGVRLRY